MVEGSGFRVYAEENIDRLQKVEFGLALETRRHLVRDWCCEHVLWRRERGAWLRVQGSGFRVQGSGFRVQGLGSGFGARGSGNTGPRARGESVARDGCG